MKDQAQLFIDQRGKNLRALIVDSGRVLASGTFAGPLESGKALAEQLAGLMTEAGRKPECAHLLIASEQVKLSTYRLQEMSLADAEKVIQRSLTTATGEPAPLFRLTPLAAQQEKEVFLAEQIPRETVNQLLHLFAAAHLQLSSISTVLQATLAAFAPHRDEILQAHAIFDISLEAISAVFLAPTEILYHETVAIQEREREPDNDNDADPSRARKRRLFAILNIIHGLYSQYMLVHPHSPVEKVWLSGSEGGIEGLAEALVDAMDVEVAPLDLLAGQIPASPAFTPLAGLIDAQAQAGYANFIPTEISQPTRVSIRNLAVAVAGLVALLLIGVVVTTQSGIWRLEQQLKKDRYQLQLLQAKATAEQGRSESLRFLKQLGDTAPPLDEILAEIASRLPREVQIDGINLRQDDTAATLEVLAVTRHETPWQNERVFTALMASLDGSKYLVCDQEPDLAVQRVGEQKLIKIRVSCQVSATEGGAAR